MAIRGDHLLGFSDFFSTDNVGFGGFDDEIGAAKPKGKPAPKGKGKPAQVRPYPKPARTTAMKHHGVVLHGARGVATKAAQVIGKAMHLLSQKPGAALPPAKPGMRTPPAKALAGRPVHVGAVAAAAMSPKAKLAVQKHNAAVAKSAQAGKVLAQHAIQTKKSLQVLAKHAVAQKKLAKVMRTKRGAGKVHVGMLLDDPMIGEAVGEVLADYYTAVGAKPDPTNPGYLDDSSPDPAAMTTDPTAGLDGMDLGPLTEDPLDSGVELPPAPPMDHYFADMAAPGVGGIAYDGSKGTPDGYCLSYGLATRKTDYFIIIDSAQIDGTEHHGYVFGKYDLFDPPNGGVKWGSNFDPGQWNEVHGRFDVGRSGWHNPVDAATAFASNTKSSPHGVPYGPLVGNPAMPDFKAMRVDGQGNMFWLPQEAPDWLTFPIKQAAALTAQAAAKAAKDAAAADAAAQAKASADAAAAQAAQDAANALAESGAASQAKIAQGEQTTAQAAAETQAQQAIVQQQQAETAQYTSEGEQQKQAGALMLEQAQQQAAQDQQVQAMLLAQAQREQGYLAQHPEEEFAPQTEDGDEGGQYVDQEEPPMPGMDSGGGEGDYDDGAPMPGGDIMHDADGEGFSE